MSPEERRQAIIDAVIPLLREHGRDVSSRQLADAAGVAEGTIFRAFGDKESLIQAAIEHYFDPEPFRDKLRGIDPDAPTVDKVAHLFALLRERFLGAFQFMTAMRLTDRPPVRTDYDQNSWLEVLNRVFRPDELAVPIETLAYYLRLVAFSSVIPQINEPRRFEHEELLQLVLHGVLPPGKD